MKEYGTRRGEWQRRVSTFDWLAVARAVAPAFIQWETTFLNQSRIRPGRRARVRRLIGSLASSRFSSMKADAPGFGPWSVKDGVPHVQPPVHLLEQMLTTRLHLDDCDETNGALRVLPGSHRLGRLSGERIRQLRGRHPDHVCHLSAGDALLMRPLLLHASSRSRSNHHP